MHWPESEAALALRGELLQMLNLAKRNCCQIAAASALSAPAATPSPDPAAQYLRPAADPFPAILAPDTHATPALNATPPSAVSVEVHAPTLPRVTGPTPGSPLCIPLLPLPRSLSFPFIGSVAGPHDAAAAAMSRGVDKGLWQYTVPDSMEWQRSGDLGDHDEKHAGQGTSRQDRVGSSLLEGSRAHPNGSLEATEGAEQEDGTSRWGPSLKSLSNHHSFNFCCYHIRSDCAISILSPYFLAVRKSKSVQTSGL